MNKSHIIRNETLFYSSNVGSLSQYVYNPILITSRQFFIGDSRGRLNRITGIRIENLSFYRGIVNEISNWIRRCGTKLVIHTHLKVKNTGSRVSFYRIFYNTENESHPFNRRMATVFQHQNDSKIW